MYRDLVERGFLAKSIVPAGLTGLTQINKGTGSPLHILQLQYTALEESYASIYSYSSSVQLFVKDLGVIFRTFRVVLKGNGLDYEPGITAFSVFQSDDRGEKVNR
jgi:lipopolysaccharide/colanic/teichoic acid biosynthesis glycosyltransferase